MSLETALAENTAAMTALATIMEKMVHNQERLLAGQQAAIEKVAAGNPETATKRGRGRPPKNADAETPTTEESPAATESGEAAATTASEGKVDKPKAETPAATETKATPKFADVSKKWLEKAEKGTDEYKKRGAAIMGILGHFGAGKMSELPEIAEDEAMFYLKRHVKGLTVSYGAAYDFAGDPEQPEPVVEETAADGSDDDDDLFG